MAGLKIEGLGGENRLIVEVSVASYEYQKYLAALKKRETLREENGGDTVEGVLGVEEAAKGIDELAKRNYQVERRN